MEPSAVHTPWVKFTKYFFVLSSAVVTIGFNITGLYYFNDELKENKENGIISIVQQK